MTRTRKEDSSQLHSPQSLKNSVTRIEQLLVSARRVAAEMATPGNRPDLHRQPALLRLRPGRSVAVGQGLRRRLHRQVEGDGLLPRQSGAGPREAGREGRQGQESGQKVPLGTGRSTNRCKCKR